MFVSRSMERSGVKCFQCTHVFDLTNLKGEKRRNVGKLNNELNIVNQPCRSTLPEIERTALRILGK